jgi:hypothetical protein
MVIPTTEAPQPTEARGGLIPLAITEKVYKEFVVGDKYDLWSAQYGSLYGTPSAFKGVVNFSDRGSSCDSAGNLNERLECWARYGFDGDLPTGDWIPTDNGVIHRLAKGLCDNLEAQNLYDAGGHFGLVFIPIYDEYAEDGDQQTSGAKKGQVRVVGFAQFKIYDDDCGSGGAVKAFGELRSYSTNPYRSLIGDQVVPWGPTVTKPIPHTATVPVPPAASPAQAPRLGQAPKPTATPNKSK